MAGGEPPNSRTLEYVHQQSRRADAFAKRGDFKRAISSHQAATATLRHLIRSVTEGQLASLRRTAARADEFALLDSLYAQLEQHTLRQSAILEQQLQHVSARSAAAKSTALSLAAAAQPGAPAVTVSSPGGGGGGGIVRISTTPLKSLARDGTGTADDEERETLISDLRCQLDTLARENEALTKENQSLLKASRLPSGHGATPPRVRAVDPVVSAFDFGEHVAVAGLEEESSDYLDVSIQTGRVLHDLPPLQPPAFDPQGFESD